MSKLHKFTAVIVTIGDEGFPYYHTVQLLAPSATQLLQIAEVRELLKNPDTAEVAAVFPGHHKSVRHSTVYTDEDDGNDAPPEDTHDSEGEKTDIWHITTPDYMSTTFFYPDDRNMVARGSVDFAYILDNYETFAELEAEEPDRADKVRELLEWLDDKELYSVYVTKPFLQRVISHPDTPFDVITQLLEAEGVTLFESDEEPMREEIVTEFEDANIPKFNDYEYGFYNEADQYYANMHQ